MVSHNSGLTTDSSSMSTYSSLRSRSNYPTEPEMVNVNKGHVSNSELTDRFKKLIFKSIDFLILRGNVFIYIIVNCLHFLFCLFLF